MADGVKLVVTGDKELDRKLARMPLNVARKITRSSARKAGKVVQEKAKQLVPVDTGTLRRSIKVKALKRSRRFKGIIGVTVQTGSGFFKGEQFYGAFIELGTSRQPARPFLRPAALQKSKEVARVFDTEIRQALLETTRG